VTNRLDGLELLRFIAALAVVFYHIPSIGIGHFGVDAFFVISGFVMMLSTSKTSHQFLLKRIIRIVPLYWLATLGVFAIAVIMPSVLKSTDASLLDLFKSLLFIPFDKNGVGHQPVLAVGWTLNYEIYFYGLFAFSCLLNLRYRGIITVFLVALNIFMLSGIDSFVAETYSDLIALEFGLGVALYLLLNRELLQTVVVITLISVCSVFNYEEGHRLFVYGLPSFFVVMLFILMGNRLPKSSVIPVLGGSSYALYLCHSYIIRIFDRLVDWFSNENIVLAVSAVLISLMGSIMVSIILFKYLESPLLGYLRKNLLKRNF
jgi:exopolysaccharide production protein ExoZ